MNGRLADEKRARTDQAGARAKRSAKQIANKLDAPLSQIFKAAIRLRATSSCSAVVPAR
jgi:hypothetical protein